MFLYQTTLVVENYLTYPKKTSQEVVYDVPFPGFTICLNRKVSFYDAQKWLMEKAARLQINSTFEQDTFFDIHSDLKMVLNNFEEELSIHPAYRSVEYNSFVDKSSISKEEAMVVLFGRFSNETAFHPLPELLRLEEIPGGKFFKCFTVNPLDEYKYPIEEIQAGVMDGVGMVPDMSKHWDYIWRRQSRNGGYRVYVHPIGFKVNPDTEKRYFEVEPGQDVNISINAVEEFVRIGSPHGNCSDRNPYASTGIGEPEVAYQQEECVNQCWMKKLLERDDLISMRLPPLGDMHCWVEAGRARRCNYTTTVNGQPTNATIRPKLFRPSVDLSTCPCYRPCVDIEYAVSTTSKPRPFRDTKDIIPFFIEGGLQVWFSPC